MEIIHLILGKANPERMNGVNKVVHEIATRQCIANKMVEVWGITRSTVPNYPERLFRTQLFKTHKNPFLLGKELKKHISTKNKGTVFHLHGGFIPQMYSAAMWMKRCKIPFVLTPHGSYNKIAMLKNWGLKLVYFKFFEQKMLLAAQAIHALGQSEMDGLQSIFANDKSVLIPYGFETAKNQVAWKNTPDFMVGFCGRLDIYTKGLDALLQGFKLFSLKHPSAKLWIVGDSAERGKLEKIAADLNIANAIVFWGAKFGAEKNGLLQQLNVLAVPSRNEGLPTVVLEAAAMGIPCLVTKATNTGSYISSFNAGIVMEHTDPLDICNGLKQVYDLTRNEKDMDTIRSNAKRMIREAFNWELILKQFDKLYGL